MGPWFQFHSEGCMTGHAANFHHSQPQQGVIIRICQTFRISPAEIGCMSFTSRVKGKTCCSLFKKLYSEVICIPLSRFGWCLQNWEISEALLDVCKKSWGQPYVPSIFAMLLHQWLLNNKEAGGEVAKQMHVNVVLSGSCIQVHSCLALHALVDQLHLHGSKAKQGRCCSSRV